MKLLFDQNVSFRIIEKVENVFPHAEQVRNLGLENARDIEIWDYAKKQGYTIVTFDADFFDLSSLYGHPPKIIWLRTGNRRTNDLAKILTDKKDLIKEFVDSEKYREIACIEVE